MPDVTPAPSIASAILASAKAPALPAADPILTVAGTGPTDLDKTAAPAVEAKPTEPTPVEAPKDDKIAARLSKLTAKEVAIQKEKEAVRAEREAIAKEKEAATAFAKLKENAKRDPESLAKEVWGERWYEQLTKFYLEGKPPEDLIQASIDERFAAIQKKADEEKTAAETARAEAENKQIQEAKAEFLGTIKTYASSKPDEAQFITAIGDQGVNLVHDTIVEYYQTTGNEMTIEQATTLVEDYLLKDTLEAFEKGLKIPKLAAKARELLLPKEEAPVARRKPYEWAPATPAPVPSAPATPSLTNKAGATASAVSSTKSHMSREEKAMAILDRLMAQRA